jgi:hypothetical protein
MRAGLWSGERALRAWEEWLQRGDLKNPDTGTKRLLPLVFVNLSAAGAVFPAKEELKPHYRFYFIRNTMTMQRGQLALKSLNTAGIPTLVLKAGALIPLYYRNIGARPMHDLDICVGRDHARQALKVLGALGWWPLDRAIEDFDGSYLENMYAHTLVDKEGFNLDLHRNVSSHEVRPGADDEFWQAAVPFDLEGVPTRALNPADQLLHICTHGTAWSEVPAVRWVADAFYVIKSGKVDWSRLLEQTERHRLVLVMRNTLRYLSSRMGAQIPDSVRETLDRMPVSRGDAWIYHVETDPPRSHNTLVKVWYHYDRFRSMHGDDPERRRIVHLPAYLRDVWNVPRVRDVPTYIARFAWRKLHPNHPNGNKPENLPKDIE